MARLLLAAAAALALSACAPSGPGLPGCASDNCGADTRPSPSIGDLMRQADRELERIHGPLSSPRPEPRPEGL